jgi:hypothetical protein
LGKVVLLRGGQGGAWANRMHKPTELKSSNKFVICASCRASRRVVIGFRVYIGFRV